MSGQFKCTLCEKIFPVKQYLQRHWQINHTIRKWEECTICGKSVKRLKIHMKSHTGPGPHICPICNKCFRSSSDFRNHKLIHSGERPFKCKICDKSFSQKSNLASHITTHANLRPHKCKICGKAFSRESNLAVHMAIHTGERAYVCEMCGKSFAQPAALKRHLLIHTGEKPHQCNKCIRCFKLASELEEHGTVHQNQYECSMCHKVFSRINLRNKHEKEKHQVQPTTIYTCDPIGGDRTAFVGLAIVKEEKDELLIPKSELVEYSDESLSDVKDENRNQSYSTIRETSMSVSRGQFVCIGIVKPEEHTEPSNHKSDDAEHD